MLAMTDAKRLAICLPARPRSRITAFSSSRCSHLGGKAPIRCRTLLFFSAVGPRKRTSLPTVVPTGKTVGNYLSLSPPLLPFFGGPEVLSLGAGRKAGRQRDETLFFFFFACLDGSRIRRGVANAQQGGSRTDGQQEYDNER